MFLATLSGPKSAFPMKKLTPILLLLIITATFGEYDAHAADDTLRRLGKDAAHAAKQAGKAGKKVGKDIGKAGKKVGKSIRDSAKDLFGD